MSLIDVAIPAVAGLIFLACPQLFVKSEDQLSSRRMWGVGLLLIAASYFLIKLASGR